MEITFTRATVTAKHHGYLLILPELIRKRNAVCHTHLRAKMGDHPDYMVFICSKVKRAVAALRKAAGLTLELGEQTVQRDLSCCKNSKITVHRQNVFIRLQC